MTANPLFDWSNPSVVRIIDRLTTLNRKCTPQDCEASRVACEVAQYYAANYVGDFTYMLDMRKAFDRWGKLTPAQASGTINCMMAQYRFNQQAAKKAEQAPAKTFKFHEANLPDNLGKAKIDPTVDDRPYEYASEIERQISEAFSAQAHDFQQVALDGIFTVVLDETGDYRTLRISAAKGFATGVQRVQYLSGSDNTRNYTGFAYLVGKTVIIEPQFKKDSKLALALTILLSADRNKQIDMGEAYALESGNCFRCGRLLTVPESVKRGCGPICAAELGI